jgi:hypothetical protein
MGIATHRALPVTCSGAITGQDARQRYGQLLSGAVAETLTVPTPVAVNEELRYLVNALSA